VDATYDVVATASTHQLELDPGQHEVILQRDGFIDWKTTIDVAEATPLQVSAQLVEARVTLWPVALATGIGAVAAGVAALVMADNARDQYDGSGFRVSPDESDSKSEASLIDFNGFYTTKTLTLKNLPEELHARLSAAAKRHRRSLNQEAIVCLESGLGANVPSVEEELTRIRALRDSLGPRSFDPDEIDAFKREGRP
jgi:plasmid stability protein